MIVYLDENLSKYLAYALNELQKPLNKKNPKLQEAIEVRYLPDDFGKGAEDEAWIPEVGKQQAIVITCDINIQRTRHQRELCMTHDLGIFFYKLPKNCQYWQMVKLVIQKWDLIVQKIIETKRPFAFRTTSKKPGFEDIT